MMKNKKVIIVILISVLVVASIGTAVGVSLAKWSAGEGQNTVAPQIGVTDWNYHAKYLTYDTYSSGIRITGFKTADILSDFCVPKSIDNKTVLAVSNSLFADTTTKQIPLTLSIPNSLTTIESGAFSGLVNLTKVSFEDGGSCVIGAMAFAGCNSLATFDIGEGTTLYYNESTAVTSTTWSAFVVYAGLPTSIANPFA